MAAAAADPTTGKIYVFGGSATPRRGTPLRTNEEYDPKTDFWTAKAPMPTGRFLHGAAFLNGKIYVVGGLENVGMGGVELTTVDEYDPLLDRWRTGLAPLHAARASAGVFAYGGKIWAIGGLTDTMSESYDPPSNSWTRGPGIGRFSTRMAAALAPGTHPGGNIVLLNRQQVIAGPDPVYGNFGGVLGFDLAEFGGAVAIGARVYAFGGSRMQVLGNIANVDVTDEVKSIDRAQMSQSQVTTHAPMTQKRHHLSVVVSGSKVYAIGGDDAFRSVFATVEVYTP
jgi:hypothetical protein